MQPEAGRPGPHPAPPADLADRRLPIKDGTGPWFRIHRLEHEPLYFGRSGQYRFDAPAGQYGVLYVGADYHCAFIEAFGPDRLRVAGLRDLRARGWARIESRRPLRLVDLTGPGLARLGADERLCAGDYRIAQQWALALVRHPDAPDGIYYRSRHDPSRLCVAIYHHVAAALSTVRLGSLASRARRRLLADLLDTYGVALQDDAR